MIPIILYSALCGSHFAFQNLDRGQCDCDCDCACALSLPLLETESFVSWRKVDHLYSFPLSPEYTGFISSRNDGLIVLNSHAGNILNAFASPSAGNAPLSKADAVNPQTQEIAKKLAALGLLTTANDARPCFLGETCDLSESSSRSLTSWLHLTDRCNLRCIYCYLPHVREDMSSEVGHAAVDAVFRSALANDFRRIKIKYAGGEPLLRYPLILELHAYAKSKADTYGITIEEVILSNGCLLTEGIVGELKALNIRLMLSLDGIGPYHDVHRRYANGEGSFNNVSKAVDLALANGLVPNISVTVSSRTAEGLPDLLMWILERDLPFSLNFYRENEISTSYEDMRLDEEKIINGMLSAFKVIENNLPRRCFLGGITDRANLSFSHTRTCGVGQNYLVIDQNGQVAKCQMQIRKPTTNVYCENPLSIIQSDQVGIQNISVEEKEGCKACEWKYWCTGGCPLATYHATGSYSVKSPNCKIYKTLFPEVLRLEGLRLLKYAEDPEVVAKI
jgi:uncharacterized protein